MARTPTPRQHPAASHRRPGPTLAPHGDASTTSAVRNLQVGNADRDGTPNPANGWQAYGFDLAHRASTAASVDLCQPRDGAATATVYPDGDDGIDNSFGRNVLPILLALAADYGEQVNASIASGHGTMLLTLHDLGAGASYNPMVAGAYAGAELGAPRRSTAATPGRSSARRCTVAISVTRATPSPTATWSTTPGCQGRRAA